MTLSEYHAITAYYAKLLIDADKLTPRLIDKLDEWDDVALDRCRKD